MRERRSRGASGGPLIVAAGERGGGGRRHGHGMAPVAMVGPVEEEEKNFTKNPLDLLNKLQKGT